MEDLHETIYVLVGIERDPMPEEPKRTRYWVAAGPCPVCGHVARFLRCKGDELVVECGRCRAQTPTGLNADLLPEVSYVFWCSNPQFETDEPPLTREQREEIERLLASFPDEEPAYFGVIIEAGICRRTRDCINVACQYHHRFIQPGGK